MEVLMHEASNRRENGADASVCMADPRSTFNEKRDDIGGMSSDAAHNNGRESIDIIFENITYTVSLGFRKGERPSSPLITNWIEKSSRLQTRELARGDFIISPQQYVSVIV